MWGLIYKDMQLMKKDLLFGVLGVMFFSFPFIFAYTTDEFDAFILFIVIFEVCCIFFIISNVQSGIYSHDEYALWKNYIKCAPNGNRRQISAKYVINLGISVFGLVWCVICNVVINVIAEEKQYISAIYCIVFIGQIILNAIEMPFLIRFGEKQGKVVKILMFSVIAFVAVVYLLFGDLPKVNGAEEMVNYMVDIYYDLEAYNGKILKVLCGIAPCSLVLYYLSYKVSVKLTKYC